jgi:hypothetical protein
VTLPACFALAWVIESLIRLGRAALGG